MEKHYKFAEDPGHGWLVVPIKDVEKVGAINKISKYSFVRLNIHKRIDLWLEEDCDAPAFLDAAKAHGWEVKHESVHTNNSHIIREHPRFSIDKYKDGGYARYER